MNLKINDWHRRFVDQAGWTHELRSYIYTKCALDSQKFILDAGCGTGALLPELTLNQTRHVYGLDLNYKSLKIAAEVANNVKLIQGDIHTLPFPDKFFDICLFHFVLLWVENPILCVQELKRVTRSGGNILALAEPDYGARIDYPDEFLLLGEWQRESLLLQGADPKMGRKIRKIFVDVGLKDIECGLIGGQWTPGFNQASWSNEWAVIEHDFQFLNPNHSDLNQLDALRKMDLVAHKQGNRILYVPTFYAMATVG